MPDPAELIAHADALDHYARGVVAGANPRMRERMARAAALLREAASAFGEIIKSANPPNKERS